MSADLGISASVDVDQHRLRQLLAQQAEIQAQIANLLPSSTPAPSHQHHRSPIHKHHHRRAIPRSMSSSGATMARQLSSERIEAPARTRTLSQRSAPAPLMARTNSRGTSSARSGNLPFTTQNGTMAPLRSEQRENPSMDTWIRDQSLSAYTFNHQAPQIQRSTSQRSYGLEKVSELCQVFENPHEYLSRTVGTPTLPISPPFLAQPLAALNSRLSSSPFNIAITTTPSSESLTTGSTLPSIMSRQNSLCNEPVLESFQMMKFNSNTSFSSGVNNSYDLTYDQVNSSSSSSHNRRSSSKEQTQYLAGIGGVIHNSPFSHSFPSEDAFPSTGFGEKMEKSQSSESTSSNTSSSTRNKQRLQAATLAASRPLMPKGDSGENMSRASSSESMARLESKDGSQDNKVAIPKPTYQRPKHERVFCKLCESHPDGFRGEHELRRHQDREHKRMVKKWVCIEPTNGNHLKPELPLSKCKACGQQKKKYGAYYNAAAHLRRTHFKPKAKGRGKTSKGGDDEKRGGKGGGDWPPMPDLKHWMKEVEESAPEYSASQQDEAAEPSDDDTLESNFDDHTYPSQHMSGVVATNFDHTYLTDSSPMLDVFPPNNDMYNMHNMHNMPLELGTEQTSCVDSSMYGLHNFPSNFSNDATMAFFDSSVTVLPQSFDDQILTGQDFANFPYQ